MNQDIREASAELLAQVATQVADFEDGNEESKETAKDVIDLLTQVWNEENEHSVKIEPTVKAGTKLCVKFSRNFIQRDQNYPWRRHFEDLLGEVDVC